MKTRSNNSRDRSRRWRSWSTALCLLVAPLLLLSPSSASAFWFGGWWTQPAPTPAPAPTPTPATLPTVTEVPAGSGQHGHPFDAVPTAPIIPGAPSIDLAAQGYVEREFIVSGGATVYSQSGTWGSNGRWGVSVSQTNVPYTTRMIVRYPTDPAKFNGTVIVEWLNDTTGADEDPVWSQIYDQVIRNGYAYVGVTVQNAGMGDLVAWDPIRYGSLGDSNDGQSYDIFTQVARVVKNESSLVLGGLQPQHLIGAGDSQSAIRMVTYVNAIQPVAGVFDGFLAVGRAGPGAPLGNGLVATSPLNAQIRTDNTAKMIQLNTEGDIVELGAGLSRQSDNSALRTWELPGAAHIDDHEATYEIANLARDVPEAPVPSCAFGTPITGTGTVLDGLNAVNNMPLYEVERAALAALHAWLVNGTPPPHSPQISTVPFFLLDVVLRDQYGNALGGIRLPEIAVPTETYSPINFAKTNPQSLSTNPLSLFSLAQQLLTSLTTTGSISDPTLRHAGLCLLSGFYLNFSSTQLQSLYPTHADYVAKYKAAAQAVLNAGFMTPFDYQAAIARAEAAPIPQ